MEGLSIVVYAILVPLFSYDIYLEISNKQGRISNSKYARWMMAVMLAGSVLDGIIFFLELIIE